MPDAAHEIAAIRRLPYGIGGFRRFSKLLNLKIHPFQAFMLRFHFAGVTELVILISKKNGKTTLMAALALYRLLTKSGAEVVIGASSRDQATILFNQAVRMVTDAGLHRRRVDDGEKYAVYEGWFEVRTGYRVIRFETGRIRVLAADADTADGVIPDLALVDELHRHPSGDLYGVFRDGLLGDAQMITISTAGATLDSPLGALLEQARTFACETLKRRRTYTSPDGSTVLIEWALGPDDDPHDLKAVKSVNPAPWHTVKSLRRRHDSPSMTPGQWLRFACGIWTAGDEPSTVARLWERAAVDPKFGVQPGEWVWIAPSVGHNAAVAIAAARSDDRVAVRVEHLPADEERSILERTEDLLVDLCSRYAVAGAAVPLAGFRRSKELLEGRGVPVVETPHSPIRLVEMSATLDKLLVAGKLSHDGDPQTKAQMLAAQKKVNEGGERYLLDDHSRAVVAVAAAVHQVSAPTDELRMVLPGVG